MFSLQQGVGERRQTQVSSTTPGKTSGLGNTLYIFLIWMLRTSSVKDLMHLYLKGF